MKGWNESISGNETLKVHLSQTLETCHPQGEHDASFEEQCSLQKKAPDTKSTAKEAEHSPENPHIMAHLIRVLLCHPGTHNNSFFSNQQL